MLSLTELKSKLLRTHRTKSNQSHGEEYEQGFLAGLESVLMEIDRAMESELESMAREYEKDE